MFRPTDTIVVPSDWMLKIDAAAMITIVEKKVVDKEDKFLTDDGRWLRRSDVVNYYERCTRKDSAQRVWAHKYGYKYVEE